MQYTLKFNKQLFLMCNGITLSKKYYGEFQKVTILNVLNTKNHAAMSILIDYLNKMVLIYRSSKRFVDA